MGKTTLARLVCQDPRIVSTAFDFVVWVQVPPDFAVDAIEKAMLEAVTSFSPQYYNSKLLQHALVGKRILLVLDGTWEDSSVEKWRALMATLRNCSRGSRILLTTRMRSVVDMVEAAIGSPAECLELGELGENDSLLLFRSRLPSQVYSEDYAHLRLIVEQIADRAGGCPLLTEKVASWLGSHLETHHWNAVLKEGWQKLGLEDIFASLRLSHDHLPSELQNCFRYCSIFPKGYRFNKVELANMWIASGMVSFSSSEQDGTGLQNKKDANLFKYYLLHSLMHDCAQFVSQKECARVDNDHFQHVKPTTLHLSIAYCGNLTAIPDLGHLRTLIIQGESCLDEESERVLGKILHSSKRLRMLYLDVPSLSHALDRISDLTQLRYLFLYSCDKSHIQRVFKLYRLQVFKLNYFTGKDADLSGIKNLCSLRCLHVPDNMLSKILQIGISTTLQELHGFEVVKNDDYKLSILTNLRRLSLRNLQNVRDREEAMEVKLKDKPHMRFLSLSWNKHSNDPDNLDHQVIDCLEPNKGIQRLHIYGYNGVQLPIWIEDSLPIHLVSLELEYCMKWRTLPSFKELSSLKYLKLEHLFQLGTVLEEQHGSKESDNAFLPPFLNTLISGGVLN
ncbi:putative disease resistance protein RGA4 [Oryza brachyantha]|uniref:putative disease resistance protein RGA4 n=1 Tax=Oryza brachyantha TaxID=4533 RepID=UPI001AD9BA67|nr:putative disease resistance protein RGA4 [Oryza brachyantha]